MNFIACKDDLKQMLEEWAGDSKVIISSFFFWRPGTAQQKSINGLLRALLHQILSQSPRCFEMIEINTYSWTDHRLEELIRAIAKIGLEDVKFCFLIDGLDEFEGDEDSKGRLVALIKSLVENKGIKALVSSRPEPFLIESFSCYSQLRLQDLTMSDIHTYVESRLISEGRMKAMQREAPKKVQSLISEVSRRADGVFLWARLAVQDLIGGIRARDSLDTLMNRLSLLNNSLDEMFSQLLSRIHPVHQQQAANYLRFVMTWTEYRASCHPSPTLSHLAFGFCEGFKESVESVLGSKEVRVVEYDLFRQKLEDFQLSLLSHTAGLLDVTYNDNSDHLPALTQTPHESATTCLASHYTHCLEYTRVHFVHRSAYDFLTENEDGKRLLSKAWTAEGRFHAVAIGAVQNASETILACMRNQIDFPVDANHVIEPVDLDRQLHTMTDILSTKTNYIEAISRHDSFNAIQTWFKTIVERFAELAVDAAEKQVEYLINSEQYVGYGSFMPPEDVFFVYLVRSDAASVILDNLRSQDQKSLRVLMDMIVGSAPWCTSNQMKGIAVKLLELGVDANSSAKVPEVFLASTLGSQELGDNSLSFWEYFLDILKRFNRNVLNAPAPQLLISIAEAFTAHGADMDIGLRVKECYSAACRQFSIFLKFSVDARPLDVIELFCKHCGLDATRIRDQMRAAGAVSSIEIRSAFIEKSGQAGSSGVNPERVVLDPTEPKRIKPIIERCLEIANIYGDYFSREYEFDPSNFRSDAEEREYYALKDAVLAVGDQIFHGEADQQNVDRLAGFQGYDKGNDIEKQDIPSGEELESDSGILSATLPAKEGI